MRLIEKLVLLLLGISLLPLSIIGAVSYQGARNIYINQEMNHLETVATLQEHRLSAIHDQNQERLNTFSSRTPLLNTIDHFNKTKDKADQQLLQTSLSETQTTVPIFSKLTITNVTGTVIASTDSSLLNTDQTTNPLFQPAMNGKKTVDAFKKDKQDNIIRQLSGPMLLNGKLVGVALLETTNQQIVDLAHDYTGLGQTGETVVVQKTTDGQPIFLTPLRFKPDAALSNVGSSEFPLNQALDNKEQTFYSMVDYRGTATLAVSRFVDNSGQGIVVKIDKTEALAPINRLFDKTIVLSFVVVVLIVSIALSLARKVSDPILDIDEVAEKISRGNLSQRVMITTKDELSNLAGTFNEMLDSLERLDKVKSEFVSLASHQLRTPASGVKARLSLLINGYAGKLSKEQLGHLNQIYETNEREIRVINDLLNVAIIESGHMKLDKKETDIAALINGVVAELQELLSSRHQTLEFQKPKKAVMSMVDPDKLRMVVDNLLSNASKFTNDGDKISISVYQSDDNEMVMTFSDTGVGIDPRDIDKLFQKFSQADNHMDSSKRKSGSVGLGLFLVKNIVELHGGTISVSSEPGKGTTFTIKLPLR